MEQVRDFAEQVLAAEQVGAVVDVATVERATTGAHDACFAKRGQMIRDQVLRLPDELDEFANPTITATQLHH